MEHEENLPHRPSSYALPSSLDGFQLTRSPVDLTGCGIAEADGDDHKQPQAEQFGPFKGLVYTQDYSDAIASAHKAGEITCSERMLILWTDASLSQEPNNRAPSGYAVVARQESGWTGRIGHSFETFIDNAEMCAISAALHMAIDEVQRSKAEGRYPGGFGPVVRIYTDSLSSLKKIRAFPQRPRGPATGRQRHILRTIVRQSHELEEMAQLMMHWVPRGRVDANRVADRMSKSAVSVYRTSMDRLEGNATQNVSSNEVLNDGVVDGNYDAVAAHSCVHEQAAGEDSMAKSVPPSNPDTAESYRQDVKD